jgi:hypothetical protein
MHMMVVTVLFSIFLKYWYEKHGSPDELFGLMELPVLKQSPDGHAAR